MATATKHAPAKAAHQKDGGAAAVDRLESSLDAAQKALVALRGDVSTGGKDLAKNAERSLEQARKDSAKLVKAVRSDLSDLQKAITSPPAHAKKRTAARKTAAARR